jgi:salicylate hydroxylase
LVARHGVVIAGAGLGGLTAALTLARRGFSVVICERARQLAEVGAGIQISPNAGHVLKDLGLDQALAAAASEPVAIDVRSGATGRAITSASLSAFRQRYGLPYRSFHRVELQRILASAVAAEPRIELRLGTTVAGFVREADGVVVRLERAGAVSLIEAIALIAADGVWSSLREALGGRPARPTGRTAWRATVPAGAAPPGLPADRIGLWLGRNAHLVHYPVRAGKTINVVAIVEEDWHGEGWSEPGDRAQVARAFAGWAAEARAIIAAPAEWRKWALVAVNPHGPWTSDRAALLGDAAHAMLPFLAQGAAMAIEDAAVLAASLARGGSDVAGALRAYENERKMRVIRLAAAAKQVGDTYHFGSFAAFGRDVALRLAGERLMIGGNDWIYGWRPPA